MGSFMHTPDGDIVINDKYRFSLSLFKKLEPQYSLPDGIISRIYVQDTKHTVSSGKTQTARNIPWKDGDAYIERLSEILYLEQHEKIKEQERKEYLNRIKNDK
ncbi:TPA: hypothetical protein HA278_05565 [Candidatus Woesearchaeota archaeon]|nr:hypothetical protein [Candidatus Woesearchaeota archaeon]